MLYLLIISLLNVYGEVIRYFRQISRFSYAEIVEEINFYCNVLSYLNKDCIM